MVNALILLKIIKRREKKKANQDSQLNYLLFLRGGVKKTIAPISQGGNNK